MLPPKELDDSIEYKIWIVWKLNGNQPVIVAIDTSEGKANRHVAYDKECDRVTGKVPAEYFVEDSRTNHLHGQSVTDLASFKLSSIMKRRKTE